MNEVHAPVISIIIAAFNASQTIEGTLRALITQETDVPYEVIVVDSSVDDTLEIVRQYEQVRVLHFDQRKYCGEARNIGNQAARGEILAYTDADCIPRCDWVQQVWRVHQETPALAVGGAIASCEGENAVSRAAYLCEFTPWLPGAPAGWIDDAAGANLTYKRAAFQRFGPFVNGVYCSDTEFHWRMAAAGERVWFDPALVVHHRSLDNAGRFLRHEFEHGRSFGRMRCTQPQFTPARRALYAAAWFIIPAQLFINIIRRFRTAGKSLSTHWRALPWLIIGLFAWSAGECAGYILGRPSTVGVRRHS